MRPKIHGFVKWEQTLFALAALIWLFAATCQQWWEEQWTGRRGRQCSRQKAWAWAMLSINHDHQNNGFFIEMIIKTVVSIKKIRKKEWLDDATMVWWCYWWWRGWMGEIITKDHRGLDQARPASNQPGHTPNNNDYHDDGDGDGENDGQYDSKSQITNCVVQSKRRCRPRRKQTITAEWVFQFV